MSNTDNYHLNRYAELNHFTPELIRYRILNDGHDTLVFRAQDVCAAIGALDYYAAMSAVDPSDVVMFTHPDTDAQGMRYACVHRKGLYQIAESMKSDDDSLSARCWSVIRWAEKVLDEQAT